MYRYYVTSHMRIYTNDDQYKEANICHEVKLDYPCNTVKNINKLRDTLKEKVVEDNENIKSVSLLYILGIIELTLDEEDDEE